MKKRQRFVLDKIMLGIIQLESMGGEIIFLDNLKKHIKSKLKAKISPKEFNEAIEYMRDNCAIYMPGKDYLVKF